MRVSSEKRFSLPRAFLVKRNIYYVRLIVTGAKIKPRIFNQQILTVSQGAPNIKLL